MPNVAIENAILMLKTADEARFFMEAVLSEEENRQLRKRWEAYQLRAEGLPIAKVGKRAHVSVTTATRAAALHHSAHHVILDTLIARATSPQAAD
jgi:uncharacterized protein YerC